MPNRADIDPTELPGRLWPHIMMVDVVHDGKRIRFRYRRIGGHFVEAFGSDPTGKFLDDVLPTEYGYRDYIHRIFCEIATARHPLYTENIFTLWGQTVPRLTRRVSLPLSGNDADIDAVLVGHVFTSSLDINDYTLLSGFSEKKWAILD